MGLDLKRFFIGLAAVIVGIIAIWLFLSPDAPQNLAITIFAIILAIFVIIAGIWFIVRSFKN